MKILAILLLALAMSAAVHSAEPPTPPSPSSKITVREALALATALRNLDGHMVVVKQAGNNDGTIMTPWEFNSGTLRLKIANDLAILAAVEQKAETARQSILREAIKRAGFTELRPGMKEYDEFQKEYGELLDQPAPGSQDLARIKASELKLDRNEIPGTVLAALRPILEVEN